MNRNLFYCLVIVGAAAVTGLLQANRQRNVSKERAALENEARSLGMDLGDRIPPSSDGLEAERGAAKARNDGGGNAGPRAEARTFAQELVAFAQRMKEIERSGKELSREGKAELFAFLNRFLALDAEVLTHLMEEVRAYDGLEEQDKRNILKFAMKSMLESDPRKVLELYLSSGDHLGPGDSSNDLAEKALQAWAAKDPIGAYAWIEKHAGKLPERSVSPMRNSVIAQALAVDPDFAAEKALDLNPEQLGQLAEHFRKVERSPEDQLGTLRQLQDRLGALPADPSEMDEKFVETARSDQLLRAILLTGVGRSLARKSFESSRDFLESANLEPSESYAVAHGILERSVDMKNPGPWLPWANENIPEDNRDEIISEVVGAWTQRDHRATAEWIIDQPQGPLRERATYSFARTVSGTEPESAAEWALTLPPSERRTDLLRKIHEDWREQDSDAAATFARRNGLEVE